VNPSLDDLIGKKLTASQAIQITRKSYDILSVASEFNTEHLHLLLRELVDEMGLTVGQVFGVLRVAVTGRTISPPLFESMEIIGKEKVLERIHNAIYLLENADEDRTE